MKNVKAAVVLAIGAAIPPAWAGAPNTEAVEFYNVATRHFFITASARDVSLIEQGAAGQGWVRTGRSFQAWTDAASAPATAAPVCRFYSLLANSHFFTASAADCATVKSWEVAERAKGGQVMGWQYEGTAFYIEAPQGGQCPAGTIALQRFYNRGYETGEGGNHRYVDDSALKALMDDSGWVAEGVEFCSRAKDTGTNANLPATTTSFAALAGTWRGTAKFEIDPTDTEFRRDLELTFGADGAISGSGFGCTFAGKVASGDGFRSLFQGSVTASGCENAAFNGTYTRVRLQRFESSLLVRLKQGDDATEVSIDARLTGDAAIPTPPNGAPGAGSFAAVAGDWTGTVKFETEAAGRQTEVNRALDLTIGADGTVSGSGFGCTLSGRLAAHGAAAVSFDGGVTASGCEDTAFNGDFPRVQVTLAAHSRLEAHFKREDASGEVSIQGKLDDADDTPNGNPNGNGNGGNGNGGSGNGGNGNGGNGGQDDKPAAAGNITGAWNGNATLTVDVQSTSGTLALTIGSDGTVSGSGFGCTFAGVLTLSGAPSQGRGSITASGCANATVNGTFRDVGLDLEDGNALGVELERESGRTKVKVKARLGRA